MRRRFGKGDEVRCDNWFDPQKGALAFLLDILVTEGKLIHAWSDDKKQVAYHEPDIGARSHRAV